LSKLNLKVIPEEVKHCTKIQYLDLSSNQITKIENLDNLKNLEWLLLNSNQILKIENLDNLKNLTLLYLSTNKITELEHLDNLHKLKWLDLSYNKIGKISPLKRLRKLRKLYLNNNPITNLKPLLPFIKENNLSIVWKQSINAKLDEINVKGCPLVNPPQKIVQEGNHAIFQYFEEIRKKETIINNEVKFILVGNSTAGKTSLSRFIRKHAFDLKEPTTHGIRVDTWNPLNNKINVTIWDFGGQEYYHATHRLFLSENAVYGLIFDSNSNTSGFLNLPIYYSDKVLVKEQLEIFSFPYWLSSIRRYAKESKIFTIQTKMDENNGKIIRIPDNSVTDYQLEESLINFRVSVKKAYDYFINKQQKEKKWWRKFEDLEEKLIDVLVNSATNWTLVKRWTEVKDELRLVNNEKKFILYEEFEKLVQGTEGDFDINLAIIYLRDMAGSILYYPNNSILKDKVFIGPNWLHQKIYNILDYNIKNNGGKFDKEHVKSLIKEETTSAEDFIAIMKEFELIFEIRGFPGQYIAPQYLPFTFPHPNKLKDALKFANVENILTIYFHDFLPRSTIARFISRTGMAATEDYYWKFGILYKKDLSIFVECFHEKRSIKISIQRSNREKQEALTNEVFSTFLEIIDIEDFDVSLNCIDKISWLQILDYVKAKAIEIPLLDGGLIPIKDLAFLLPEKLDYLTNIEDGTMESEYYKELHFSLIKRFDHSDFLQEKTHRILNESKSLIKKLSEESLTSFQIIFKYLWTTQEKLFSSVEEEKRFKLPKSWSEFKSIFLEEET